MPLCPPQIPHEPTPGSNPGLRAERLATNRLSHGTAIAEQFVWVGKLALGQVYLLKPPLTVIIPPVLHINSSVMQGMDRTK